MKSVDELLPIHALLRRLTLLFASSFVTSRRAPLFLALFPVRTEHFLSDVFRQISKLLIFLRR
jgi:hypothetical protein